MYGLDGREELPESTLEHLTGYDNARPVRIGNEAYMQAQHDVWGAIIGSIYLFVRKRDRLDDRLWKIIIKQVEDALATWRTPTAACGRCAGSRSTSPRPRSSAGWRPSAAPARPGPRRPGPGAPLAGRRRRDPRGRARERAGRARVFTAHYGATALDASALLIPLLGFLPADDKRVRETVLAIADELSEDDLVLRYRATETDDGFRSRRGTFTICSFWLVSALVMIGELDRARALCELLSYAGPLQLYAEEIDPHTGRHLGSFPQAFTHLALINAVMQVIRAENDDPQPPFA